MRKFEIELPDEMQADVEAESLKIEGGAAIFTNATVGGASYPMVAYSLTAIVAVYELPPDAEEADSEE